MTTRNEAIKLAEQEVANGFATGWSLVNGEVCLETDQGWRTIWPCDPEPDNYPD